MVKTINIVLIALIFLCGSYIALVHFMPNSILGLAQTTTPVIIKAVGQATTTLTVDTGTTTKGACLKLKDNVGSTYTYCSVLSGTMTCGTTACN